MGAPGPTVPEAAGARLAPEQGGSGDSIPLGPTASSAQEGTRSLSMVQESN